MFELIGLAVTGAAAAGGYLQSRAFVKRRLKYVDLVHRSSAPVIAGAAAAVVAAPVAAILPLIGTGTVLAFGVAVGAGVSAGSRELRRRLTA